MLLILTGTLIETLQNCNELCLQVWGLFFISLYDGFICNSYKDRQSNFLKLYRKMVLNWNCLLSLQDVLPSLLPYCHQVMCGRDQASHQLTIHLLTHVTQQKAPPPTDGSELAQLQAYMMDFGVTKKLVHFILIRIFCKFFISLKMLCVLEMKKKTFII